MGKKKKKKGSNKNVQPYRDMYARRSILITGFVLVLVSFVVLLYGCLCLFVPDVNFFNADKFDPRIIILVFLGVGVGGAFIGTIFVVAGANVKKSIARLGMFIGANTFLLGTGVLIVVLLVNILPFPALRRLAQDAVTIIPAMLI